MNGVTLYMVVDKHMFVLLFMSQYTCELSERELMEICIFTTLAKSNHTTRKSHNLITSEREEKGKEKKKVG